MNSDFRFAIVIFATAGIMPDWAGLARAQNGVDEPTSRILENRVILDFDGNSLVSPKQNFQIPEGFPVKQLKSDAPAALMALDSDGDELTDAEESQLGTDSQNPDTDGDGLPDGWEVHGVNGVDLRALGASPLHKDVFVWMDYMERDGATNGLGPNSVVLAGIRNAFLSAPVQNPDGLTGINIHLVIGKKVQYVDDLNPVVSALAAIKKASFDPAKAPVFHYMVWANGYDGGTSSGYSISIPGSDFVVTLGKWNNAAGGSNEQKIGTFIHELGHNLGLRHGGADDVNYKPNHLSLMNYSFQMSGVQIGGRRSYTYQPFALPALDETKLDEKVGLNGGSKLAKCSTIFFDRSTGQFVEVPADGPIDWNRNGVVDAKNVSVDLNSDDGKDLLSDTPDQWTTLIYKGGTIGSKARLSGLREVNALQAPLAPKDELTEQMNFKLLNRQIQ
ncbi:hypothetical protein IYY11_02040 [Methylocystis sp. H62]|uniref:hypothetical protein n=1 Tax=Methylocystis sp. H62 TaxID=2785789 RepID=UPI0018C29F6A|nr:hypothetical protein [Methylocystis sp. H62]MBG0792251.1 hypothetical protein [Methylocystis sp. H62]